MKFLLTGFEPFGDRSVNPSQQVVQALAQQEIEGIELVTAVLPVERFEGPDALMRHFIKVQPDAVVCLGEAGGRAGISIERVAVNLLDFHISDNGGHLVTDKPIKAEGHDAYFTTLPVRAIYDALTEAGIPAELSLSAGAFLCNQVTYELLHYLRSHKLKTPAGFVHLPWLPQQAAGQRPLRPSMHLDTMIRAVKIVLTAVAKSA